MKMDAPPRNFTDVERNASTLERLWSRGKCPAALTDGMARIIAELRACDAAALWIKGRFERLKTTGDAVAERVERGVSVDGRKLRRLGRAAAKLSRRQAANSRRAALALTALRTVTAALQMVVEAESR